MNNMKRFFLFSILFIIAWTTQSQCLIVNESKYKAGIYKSFEEFKYNNPSIEYNYDIISSVRRSGMLSSSSSTSTYRIAITKEIGKSIGRVFGFCDGENVYINFANPNLGPKTDFFKIECFGRYCYFKEVNNYSSGPYNTSSIAIVENVIDINSGKVIAINKKSLQKLIANDDELLNEFKNDSHKNEKLKEYIIKFNFKNT